MHLHTQCLKKSQQPLLPTGKEHSYPPGTLKFTGEQVSTWTCHGSQNQGSFPCMDHRRSQAHVPDPVISPGYRLELHHLCRGEAGEGSLGPVPIPIATPSSALPLERS